MTSVEPLDFLQQDTPLTPEQCAILDARVDPIAEETMASILAGPREPDLEVCKRWLKVFYELEYKIPMPERIEVVGSPDAATELASKLCGEKQTGTDGSAAGDAHWIAHYQAMQAIGAIDAEKQQYKELLLLRDFQRNVWDTKLLDGCIILVRYPRLHLDAAGNLHRADGAAVEWEDGKAEWSWHGTSVPERLVMSPTSYTRSDYLAADVEVRRALGERAGWAFVVELVGAKSINSWTDPVTKLEYELFSSENESWLKKQSPVLQAGDQPSYFEPVHEDLRTAQAARKWQATRLTVSECERDPKLVYDYET